MPQHDYVIDDASGAAVRTDLNGVFQAVLTNNSGDSIPATPTAGVNHYQWYANTSTGFLSYKDGSGNNLAANYFNIAKLTGGLNVDQPSDFNGDVIFNGTHSNSAFKIYFDADNTGGFGALIFNDLTKLVVGTDQDMGFLHSSGVNVITSITDSPLLIQTGKGMFSYNFRIETTSADGSANDTAYEAIQDGGQKLYFNSVKKLETTANGITVTGSVTATAQPACLLIDPVDTTVTSTNQSTPIKFNTQQTNVGCTVNTDKDRITVPSSGTYLISVCLSGHENVETVGTDRLFKILKNGSDAVNKNAFPRDARSRVDDGFSDVINMPLSLNANDYLELCFEEVGLGNFEVEFGYFSVTKLH